MSISRLRSISIVLAALLFAPAFADDKPNDDGFVPLWNGKDFADFEIVPENGAQSWSVADGVIQCTGKPNGYIATKKKYRNYVLKIDIRYPEQAGNSGFLIHVTPPHKVWPHAVEVQGMYNPGGRYPLTNSLGTIFPISPAKGGRYELDPEIHQKAIKPHDQWNSMEIVVNEGKITAILNGVKVAEATEPFSLVEGQIAFQSEGSPVEFRNLRIKETGKK
ncbi:MAG: DUF1080 domain-containing protein [Planctomycetaceae bacterium]